MAAPEAPPESSPVRRNVTISRSRIDRAIRYLENDNPRDALVNLKAIARISETKATLKPKALDGPSSPNPSRWNFGDIQKEPDPNRNDVSERYWFTKWH